MNDREKADKLLELVKDFVKRHEIGGPESVIQRDDPSIEAPEFVAKLCEVAGFFED